MPKFTAQRKPSQVQVNAGNALAVIKQYEVTASQCKVCQFENRREIDMQLATGMSQRGIKNHWNLILDAPYFTDNNISCHARKHLNIRDAAVRRIIEERARQINVDIATVEGFILTRTAVADSILHEGMEMLHRGDLELSAKDMLAAIQILEKMEAEQDETSIDEMLIEFRAFSDAVKEVIGEDQWGLVYEAFVKKLDERKPRAIVEAPKWPAIEVSAESVYEEDDE